jgi:hypothetical protein
MLSEENRWSGTNANNNDLMVRPDSMAGTVVLDWDIAISMPTF